MTKYVFILFALLLFSCKNEYEYSEPSSVNGIGRNEGNFICGTKSMNERQNLTFMSHCASCHSMYKDATGPALNINLLSQRKDEWILQFLINRKHVKVDDLMRKNIKKFENNNCMIFDKRDSSELLALIKELKRMDQ